jgi:hypothetical protein
MLHRCCLDSHSDRALRVRSNFHIVVARVVTNIKRATTKFHLNHCVVFPELVGWCCIDQNLNIEASGPPVIWRVHACCVEFERAL